MEQRTPEINGEIFLMVFEMGSWGIAVSESIQIFCLVYMGDRPKRGDDFYGDGLQSTDCWKTWKNMA